MLNASAVKLEGGLSYYKCFQSELGCVSLRLSRSVQLTWWEPFYTCSIEKIMLSLSEQYTEGIQNATQFHMTQLHFLPPE